MSRDFTNLHEVHNFLRTYEFVECLFFLIKTHESEDSREGENMNIRARVISAGNYRLKIGIKFTIIKPKPLLQ